MSKCWLFLRTKKRCLPLSYHEILDKNICLSINDFTCKVKIFLSVLQR